MSSGDEDLEVLDPAEELVAPVREGVDESAELPERVLVLLVEKQSRFFANISSPPHHIALPKE